MKRILLPLIFLCYCLAICAQVNDDCALATPLNVGTFCSIDTFSANGATAEDETVALDPSCGFYQGSDVWFTFVMPASGNIRLDLQRIDGSRPETALYSGTCGNFTELICNQLDYGNTYLNANLAGQTLYLRVFPYADDEGEPFGLCVWEPTVPENNNCNNAIALPTLTTTCVFDTFTNKFADAEPIAIADNPSCGFYQGSDVWFTFVMPSSGNIRLDLQRIDGSRPETALYSGTCGNFTQLICNQLDYGNTYINANLAGQTLYLRVFPYADEEGEPFGLCVWEPIIPSNNDCSNPIALPTVDRVCTIDTFTNEFATGEATTIADNPSCGFYQGGDVWFTFVMPASGNLRLDLQRIDGSRPETALYSGTCGIFTELICNQLDYGNTYINTNLAGQTLYLRVFPYADEEGEPFGLCVWEPIVPENNECINAIVLPVALECKTDTFTNAFATDDGELIAPNPGCGFYKGGDVWFKTIVPSTGLLTIEVDDFTNPATDFALYTGSCGDFELLSCGQLNNNELIIDADSLIGEEIYIRVFTYNNEEGGEFAICAIGCVTTNETIIASTCDPAAAGTVIDSIITINGCDSIITTVTELLPTYNIPIQETTCDPNEAGTEIFNLETVDGCDSIVTITTALLPSNAITINATTCDPNNAGSSTETLTNIFGCDSVVTTIVELLDSYDISISETSCDPNDVGTEVLNLTSSDGCDSIVTITTELLPSNSVTLTATTCNPNNAGSSTETLTNIFGCDSVVTTIVELLDSYDISIDETSCDPNDVGTEVLNLTSSDGCDSIVTITTTLLPSNVITINATTCNPNNAGSSTETLTNIFGCDSVVTTIVELLDSYDISIDETSCDPNDVGTEVLNLTSSDGCDSTVTITSSLLPNNAVTINATTCNPNNAGSSTETLTNIFGCDSVVTTIVELLDSYDISIEETSCNPNDVGIEVLDLTSIEGCDSTVTITTTLLPSNAITINATTCNPNNAGSSTETLTNIFGCDSVVTTIVELLDSYDISIEETSCNPNDVGIEVLDLTSIEGCDSTVTITTTLLPSNAITINATTCNPNNAGSSTETLTNIFGCDSVVTTIVELLDSYDISINETSCNPNEVGTDVLNLTSVEGCDSIVTINTTLLPSYYLVIDRITCDSNDIINTIDSLTSVDGCDSIIETATVVIGNSVSIPDTVTLDCNFDEDPNNPTAEYCLPIPLADFIAQYELEIDGLPYFDLPFICDFDTIGGYDFSTAIEATVPTYGGGVHILLNWFIDGVDVVDNNFTFNTFEELAAYMLSEDPIGDWRVEDGDRLAGGFPMSNADYGPLNVFSPEIGALAQIVYNSGIAGRGTLIEDIEPGCHLFVLTDTESPNCPPDSFYVCVECDQCEPTNDTLFSTTCLASEAGVMVDSLTSSEGCDSIITTITELLESFEVTITQESCNPDDIGIEEVILTASNGCDSIVTTATELVESFNDTVLIETCNPMGVYTEVFELTSVDGCDSIVTLIITLIDSCFIECETPENLYASHITFTQATLGWDPVPTAYSYTVEGRIKNSIFGVTQTRVLTTNSFRTHHLFPFLTYEFRVVADCFVDGYIEWSDYTDWYEFTLNPFLHPNAGKVSNSSGDDSNLKQLDIFNTDDILTTYPNPSYGSVNLGFAVNEKLDAEIIIIDISGRVVKTLPVTLNGAKNPSINIQDLKNGIYFMSLYKDGIKLSTERILLSK